MFGICFSKQRQGYNTVEIVNQQNKKIRRVDLQALASLQTNNKNVG